MEQRTNSQNNALYKWERMIAESLNERGLTVQEVIQNYTMDLFWTQESVHELLVHTAIRRMFNKTSTTELLKTGEIDKIIDVITKFIGEMGVDYIPFPSEEKVENQSKQ